MMIILEAHKERLQKELAEQCVNDTESILHDLDWWGGLDLPEGYSFDFNVYEVSHTDVNGALKAVAYLCDQRDKLGIASSSFEFSIELDVPQFLVDQYQLRKSSAEKIKVRVFFNSYMDIDVKAMNEDQAREKAETIVDEMSDVEFNANLKTQLDFTEVVYES
jgi:hypothetical protein